MAKGTKGPIEQPPNGLKRLEQRLLKTSGGPGFAAYVKENFEAFSQIVLAAGRTAGKWEEIAKWAEEENLTGGKPMKAATAKRAYEREKLRRQAADKPTKRTRSQALTTPTPRVAEVRLNASDKPKSVSAAETTSSQDKPQTIEDIRAMLSNAEKRKLPKPVM